MSDIFDDASDLEEQHRELSIKAARQRISPLNLQVAASVVTLKSIK